MNRKIALLTIEYISGDAKGKFHPDKSQLELGIYKLGAPSLNPKEDAATKRMRMQLDGSQVLASKNFIDERDVSDIAKELAEKYGGVSSGGLGGISWISTFRITSTELILKEYFNAH